MFYRVDTGVYIFGILYFFYCLIITIDSAPSLGVYYFLSLTLSVCLLLRPSVCHKSFFLFLDGIQPFLGHQFSMTKTTKRCSSIFDLGP